MDISYFWEFGMVAKHGNLSEAARELNMTESVLSRHIKALEAELGFELYDRSTSPMRLTALGELFLPLAADVGCAWNRIQAFCAKYRGQNLDIVRVRGVMDGVTLPILRDARAALEEENAHLRVKFIPQQFQTPFSDIREDKLDIAVEPLSNLIDTHDLSWFHLAYERSTIVLEARHSFAGRKSFGPDDLTDLKFTSLRSNRDNAMRKHLQGICGRHGLVGDVPKSLTTSPVDSYEELFLEGLGEYVIMLPETLAARYTKEFSDDYVIRPFIGQDVDYDWCVFYRDDAPRHVQAYLEELGKRADELPSN